MESMQPPRERQGPVDIASEPGQLLERLWCSPNAVPKPRRCHKAFTKAFLARLPGSLDDLLRAEADAQAVLFTTTEFAEGRTVAMEKRKAVFTGG